VNTEVSSNQTHRRTMLVAAFLAWMFAGLENSLFILIHRQMMLELLGSDTPEKLITEWFAWFQSAFLFGAAAGGWIFGVLGDRFGRTRAMALSVACYSTLTLCCYFVHDVRLMWALRFTACLGFGGAWPNAVALVSEAWPSASRPLMAGVMGTAANVGFVILGVIGYTFAITNDHWRWTLLVGGSPVVLAVWIFIAVPESSRWLTARSAVRDSTAKAPVIEVFQPPLLYRTLLGISLGAIPVIGTAANANWVVPWTDQYEADAAKKNELAAVTNGTLTPGTRTTGARVQDVNKASSSSSASSLTGVVAEKPAAKPKKADPRKKALTQIQRSSGAIVGSLLGGVIASLVGRRLSYFLISLATFAVSTFLFTQLNPHHALFPYVTFMLGLFGVTYFGWLPLFLPELFPTHVRSTGTGISFNTGRVIAACVVLLTAFRMELFEGDYAQVGMWSGLIYVVGMIIIWFAPRKTELATETSR
jgi:SHS family sialic acid transporter-like MFS transporter